MKQFKLPQVVSRFVASLSILGLVGLMPSGGLRTVQAIEMNVAATVQAAEFDAVNGIERKDTAASVGKRVPWRIRVLSMA